MAVGKQRRTGTLPNLIVIGATKCGTTSLHHYLGLHPEIAMSRNKELHFFVDEINWYKGLDWYRSNFTGEAAIHGETSPTYAGYPIYPGVPQRMHATVPNAKLIYIIRDPIDRTLSHYVERYADHREDRSLEEALSDPKDNAYIAQSRYCMQIKRYLAYYPESKIKIITLEDLFSDRQAVLREVFKFLQVDPDFFSEEFAKIHNESTRQRRKNALGVLLKTTYEAGPARLLPQRTQIRIGRLFAKPFSKPIQKPALGKDLRKALTEILKEDVERLRDLTHRPFEKWSI